MKNNNSAKTQSEKKRSLSGILLSSPYLVWSVIFIVAPLFFVVYYAFTDRNGNFTFDNISKLGDYTGIFIHSIWIGLISTVICLVIGAGLEDLGKGLRSSVGTIYSTGAKGVRYLDLTEGYISSIALDENNETIGYKFVRLGKMMEDIRHGVPAEEALAKNTGTYGRYADAPKYIDPREE